MAATRTQDEGTARDAGIFTDLYFASCLSTEQLARLHFADGGRPSVSAAERRLYRLARKGCVEPRSVDTPQGNRRKVWMLTIAYWLREHHRLAGSRRLGEGGTEPARAAERGGGPPKPAAGRLEHLLSTNELYVETAPLLRRWLGGPGTEAGWSWRGERRALKADAELEVPGLTFYVRNQTHRRHATPRTTAPMIEDYALLFGQRRVDAWHGRELLVLTLCRRLTRSIHQEGRRLGVEVRAGNVGELAARVNTMILRVRHNHNKGR